MTEAPKISGELLGAVAGCIAHALRADHPTVSAEEIIEAWNDIGRTMPLAFMIHEAINQSLNTAVADLLRSQTN